MRSACIGKDVPRGVSDGSRREKKYGLAFGFREVPLLFQLFKLGFRFSL